MKEDDMNSVIVKIAFPAAGGWKMTYCHECLFGIPQLIPNINMKKQETKVNRHTHNGYNMFSTL